MVLWSHDYGQNLCILSIALSGYNEYIDVTCWCYGAFIVGLYIGMLACHRFHCFYVHCSLCIGVTYPGICKHLLSDLIFKNQIFHRHIHIQFPPKVHCPWEIEVSACGLSDFVRSANRLIMKASRFIPLRCSAKNKLKAQRNLPLGHEG